MKSLTFLLVGSVLLALVASLASERAMATSPDVATFPFYDGFESGVLGADWSEYLTEEGRVQVSSSYPFAGSYSLLLDDSVDNSTYSDAAAILTIDLSGQAEVELNFWWREFDDEVHAEEGVFISEDDGANWYKVYSFDGDTTEWHNAVVDIASKAAENGLTLNDHFQIKFQFHDNWPIAPTGSADGYALDQVRVQKPPEYVLLPALLYNAGPPTAPPVLNPIDNPVGNYDYTVTWNPAYKAKEYRLEEDDNASFSSPNLVYSGVYTSTEITGKDLGTYYYRVKGVNEFGESGWSSAQSTTVTVEKPPCPQAGAWSGTTNQGYAISYDVAHSPDCQVESLSIQYRVTCSMGSWFTARTEFLSTQNIVNDHFDTGGSTPRVRGDFSTTTAANGTWSYSGVNPQNPIEYCSSSGTWTAAP